MIIKHNYFASILICFALLFSFVFRAAPQENLTENVDMSAVNIDGEIMYTGENQELISRCYGMPTGNTPNLESDYLLIDHEFEFIGNENFEKIGTYGTPVVFASQNFGFSGELNISDTVMRTIERQNWAEINVKSINLDKIEITVPFDRQLISNALAKWVGPTNEDNFYHVNTTHYGNMNPNMVNLLFECNLVNYPEYKIISSNIPNDMLKLDLYRRKDFNSTTQPQFEHMYKVESHIRNIQDFENIDFRKTMSKKHIHETALATIAATGIVFSGLAYFFQRKVSGYFE